jgi:hypothetical protein
MPTGETAQGFTQKTHAFISLIGTLARKIVYTVANMIQKTSYIT